LVKAGVAITGIAIAPHLLPLICTGLAPEALKRLVDPEGPVGTAIQHLAGHSWFDWLKRCYSESSKERNAHANEHVTKLLINACANAVEESEVGGKERRQVLQKWARTLRAEAKNPTRTAEFFSESYQLTVLPGFWEERLWPALRDNDSLEGFVWADIERALRQVVTGDASVPDKTVDSILSQLKAPVLARMRKEVVELLLNNELARDKLDSFFKSFVTRMLTVVDSKLDQVLAAVIEEEPDAQTRRTGDQRARVFFNNGFDGFSSTDDADVLFYLNLQPSLVYVGYIEILRELKVSAYHSGSGIAARPDLILEPFEGSARLTICFNSSSATQRTDEYELFFAEYNPILPDGVSLDLCDGNGCAMWTWSTMVPSEWLVEEKPFFKEKHIQKMEATVEAWVVTHNREIDRIRSRIA
jgi:hypothetical protein